MKELIEIIKDAANDRPTGTKRMMLGVLAFSIERYEESHGLIPEAAHMMRYVGKCIDNDQKSKDKTDIVGYVQVTRYVKSWAKRVNFK